MPHDRLDEILTGDVERLRQSGTDKGAESVITAVVPPRSGYGPRYLLEGSEGEFLRMNSNSYLGLSRHPAVVGAEEEAATRFGAGPGAVRFISGTYQPHLDLERQLSAFHGRGSATVYSSAYGAVLSTLSSLITPETVVLSDELNHNCIINGMRLARPLDKVIYPHLDMDSLEQGIRGAIGRAARLVIVTDGIFSMRGDHAPLDRIVDIAQRYDAEVAKLYPQVDRQKGTLKVDSIKRAVRIAYGIYLYTRDLTYRDCLNGGLKFGAFRKWAVEYGSALLSPEDTRNSRLGSGGASPAEASFLPAESYTTVRILFTSMPAVRNARPAAIWFAPPATEDTARLAEAGSF